MKKRNLRTTIILIGFLIVISGFIYLAGRMILFSRALKTYVEVELKKTFDREVTVGKIGTNIINSITFHNVAIASEKRVSEGVVLVCEKVTVNYNPFLLLKRQGFEKSMVKVILKSPHLLLTNRMGRWNFVLPLTGGKKSTLSSFPDIVIVEGKITIEDVKEKVRKVEIENISGILTGRDIIQRLRWWERPEDNKKLTSQIRFNFSGRSNQSPNDKIRLKGSYSRVTGELSIGLDILDLDLASYSNLFLQVPNFKLLTGKGNLYLNLKTLLNDENYNRIVKMAKTSSGKEEWLEAVNQTILFSGELVLAQLSFQWLSHTVKEVKGKIIFDNHRIGTQGISLRYEGLEVKLRGGIEKYLSRPALGLTLSTDFQLSILPEIVHTDGLKSLFPLEGPVKVSMDISGDLSNPELKGWFLLPRGKIRGQPVEEFQGQFVYQDRIVRIINMQGKIYEGDLVFSGNIDIDQPYVDLNFALHNIYVENFLPPDWKGKAKGNGSISGNIFGKPSEIQTKGEIELKEVKFLRSDLGTVSGFFNYASRELKIEANTKEDTYRLNTALLLGEEAIRISRLEILSPKRAGIVLAGEIGLEGKNLDITVLNSYVETGYLPWHVKASDRFSGRVNFRGKIGGTVKSPVVSGKLWSTSLKIMEERIKFDSLVHYREKILKLASFKVNNVYSADLTLNFVREIPVLGGSIQATDGDLELLSAIFSASGGKQGKIEGVLRAQIDFSNLSLSKSWRENLKAKGAVSIVKPRVGKFSVDELAFGFKIAEQELSVDKFQFSKEAGEVKGSAQMGMRRGKENIININSEWQNYPLNFSPIRSLGEERVDGSLNFRGKLVWEKDWEITGFFTGEDFKYNGEPLGAVGANLSLSKTVVHLSSFSCGSGLKGDLNIELGKEKTVTGGIEVDKMEASHFLRLLSRSEKEISFINQIKGNLQGKVAFKGPLENPQIDGYLGIPQGFFSTTGFLFKSMFNYNKRKINLPLVELKFVTGGTVIARGQIDFNKPEPLEIDVAMEKLDLSGLQSLFHNRNLNTFGEVNGNLQLRGAFEGPLLKVELKSQNGGVNGFRVNTMETSFKVKKPSGKGEERIELVFDSFSAGFGEGVLRLAEKSIIRFSLSGKLVDFSLLSEIRNINFAGLSIFGGAELNGTANFSTESPFLEVMATTRELWVNRHNFETAKLRVSFQNRKLFFLPVAKETSQLLGEIDFTRLDNFNVRLLEFFQGKDRLLAVNGSVDLSGPVDLTIQGRKGAISASLIGELLNMRIPLTGNTGFDLKISRARLEGGKKGFYDSLLLEGEIDVTGGSIRNLIFDNFNVVFKGDGDSLNVKELIINKEGEYNVKCWGTIPYAKESKDGTPIDFSLEVLDSRGSILCVLTREIREAKGELEAQLHITGTREQPIMNGYLRIDKATIYGTQVFKRIDDLICDISVKDSNIVINRINGKMEKGQMNFKGGITLAGWMPDKFNVVFENMSRNGIPLKIPFLKIPQSSFFGRLISEVPCSLELKGKIRAYGTIRSYNLEGKIELENTYFTYPPRAEDTADLSLNFLNPAVWNLEIKAGKNTWYQNRFAEVQVQGHMRLTGATKDLTVNGTITSTKGEINYLGANFIVKEATVECINDELFLEARAECPVEDDTITLVVERGKWGKVKPKFNSRSDPEMTEQEALVKATGLDTLRFSTEEGSALLRKELLKLIDSNLASPLIRSILRSTGLVDVVKVDTVPAQKTGERLNSSPGTRGREINSLLEGTEITFGKYLSSDLYLGYKLQFGEGILNRLELRHEVEVLYRLKRGISLRGKLGEQERYFGVERQIRF